MSRKEDLSEWPEVLLALGLVVGVGSGILAMFGMLELAGILGGLTGVIALALTFVIAHRQAIESNRLSKTVNKTDKAVLDLSEANERLHSLTLKILERDSEQEYTSFSESAQDESASLDGNVPEFELDALEVIRSRGSSLSRGQAIWRKKVPKPPLPGNHGWFVESSDGDSPERWFVRRGRGLTVRRAMPREFLDALEKRGVEPQQIKLDFQMKEHGLAAWYARTYSGDLWKVWRSNRNHGLGVQVKRIAEDSLV